MLKFQFKRIIEDLIDIARDRKITYNSENIPKWDKVEYLLTKVLEQLTDIKGY